MIDLHLADHARADEVGRLLSFASSRTPFVDKSAGVVTLYATSAPVALLAAVRSLDKHAIALADIVIRRPTLDDVFLSLTGHPSLGGSPS